MIPDNPTSAAPARIAPQYQARENFADRLPTSSFPDGPAGVVRPYRFSRRKSSASGTHYPGPEEDHEVKS